MSTSAVSSSSIHQQFQEYLQNRGADLGQLGKALTSGNLADTQTAFNNIVSLGKNGPFGGGNPFKLTQREQDFAAVGQALQSGDLAGAKKAFSELVNTFRHLPEGGAAPAVPGSVPEIVLNLGSNRGSGSPEQITINLNESANGGTQQGASSGGSEPSPHAQQITLNVNLANSEQIVLNLLGSSSSSSGSASSGPLNGAISVSA
jgi:hypothetical protein